MLGGTGPGDIPGRACGSEGGNDASAVPGAKDGRNCGRRAISLPGPAPKLGGISPLAASPGGVGPAPGPWSPNGERMRARSRSRPKSAKPGAAGKPVGGGVGGRPAIVGENGCSRSLRCPSGSCSPNGERMRARSRSRPNSMLADSVVARGGKPPMLVGTGPSVVLGTVPACNAAFASALRLVSPEKPGPAICMPAALNCGANAVCRSGRRERISRMTLRGSVRAIEVPFVECREGKRLQARAAASQSPQLRSLLFWRHHAVLVAAEGQRPRSHYPHRSQRRRPCLCRQRRRGR
jgi:hypothetical protein